MGFPVPYGNGMPKFLLRTAMSMLAVKEFCQSLLQFFGLCRERDNTEAFWQFTEATDAQFYPAFYSLGNCAGALRESLPSLLFEQVLEHNPERKGAQCAVCLYDIGREQEVRQLPYCSHLFHKECVDSWLDQDHKTCPLCRSSLVSEEVAQKLERRDWEISDAMNSWFTSLEEDEAVPVEPLFQDTRQLSLHAENGDFRAFDLHFLTASMA